mmetsp:Transcript_24989/g.48566  ORF Transcript_24989/g.48566 Transcript_24989/m.48566 type:complete len:214 (-) Transcript_24989:6-647(-)
MACVETSTGIIELNVGGQVFSTTRDTLMSAGDSFFSSLVGGEFGVHRDSKGLPFIDRDPKLFRHVLNFLRSQCTSLVLDKENKSQLAALQAEAEFYQVSPLIKELQMRVALTNRVEAAAHAAAQWQAAERRGRSRERKASRGPQRGSGSQTPNGDGESLSQATTIDDDSEDGGSDSDSNEGGTRTTPLSQGRYEEAAHASLISQAASNMDVDF